MKILVDADACPVKDLIIYYGKKFNIEVLMFFDTSHIYDNEYAKVITIDKGKDSVDFALIKYVNEADIVVTQDYGVACMALSKKAYALNQNGLIYTNSNIESLLNKRYLNSKIKNASGRIKGPKKRTNENNLNFKDSLVKLLTIMEEKNYERSY